MSGSNPFDDLAEDNEETESSNGEDKETDLESRTSSTNESGTELDQSTGAGIRNNIGASSETRSTSEDVSFDGPTLGNSSPPFPYSEAEQKQMYVQNGLWNEFEDRKFDAELKLRRTFSVRNVEQRELDTAIVRLVLDRITPDEIAEMVIQMRGFDPSILD